MRVARTALLCRSTYGYHASRLVLHQHLGCPEAVAGYGKYRCGFDFTELLHEAVLRLPARSDTLELAFNGGTSDLSRSRKDSFFWYQKCIKSNGEDLD